MRVALALMLASAAALPLCTLAEITSTVRIESKPSGAQVYLLRGTQRIALGRTPLDYPAEFHSSQSVLRIALERPGYKAARLELSASQSRLVADLSEKPLVADPASHSDAELRALQEEINPALKRALLAVLDHKTGWTVDLTEPAKLRRVDERTLLMIPLSVDSERPLIQDPDVGALAKELWEKLARPTTVSVAAALARPRRLDAIVVEPAFDFRQRGFRVGQRITSRTEMRCVPGGRNTMVSKYHACASKDIRGFCVSGLRTEMEYVHDPCASMQPFTVQDTTLDPSSTVTRGLARVTYLVPVAANLHAIDFAQVDAMVRDWQQKVLWQQGKLSPSL
jgi:hypothetical protein